MVLSQRARQVPLHADSHCGDDPKSTGKARELFSSARSCALKGKQEGEGLVVGNRREYEKPVSMKIKLAVSSFLICWFLFTGHASPRACPWTCFISADLTVVACDDCVPRMPMD